MKKLFNKAVSNPFISGSTIIFVGTFFGNVFNFLFNFFMIRNITVSDYGTMASLVSVILLCALAADAFMPSVIRFTGVYYAKKEINKAGALFWKLNKFFFIAGGIVLVGFLVFNDSIDRFLKINNPFLIVITAFNVFVTFLSVLNRGMILAKLSFYYISFLNFFNSLFKLIMGVVFVLLGMGVQGAMLAFFFAHLVNYALAFIPIKFVFKSKKLKNVVGIKEIVAYGAPSSLAMVGVTLFITTDIMLVKHFYSTEDAGIYAGLSLLGRIIYFFSAPIANVLFPLVVQKHERHEAHSDLFYTALLFVLISSLCIIVFYFFFPEFSINLLLKQEEYLVVKPILWIFGVFVMLYSLLSLVVNYYLSIQKTVIFIPIIIAAVLQAGVLWFYHGSFLTITIISTVSVAIPLVFTFAHYRLTYGKNKA